jgi:parvulin-like peptidyl-prolyl isomerase
MLLDKLKNEYFDKQVPVLAEQRHIMAMLLESENQATQVKAKLEGGEDFGKLASELSLESFSKDKGGDLGWRPKGILTRLLNTAVPEEYAFSNEVGLSQPVHDEAVNKTVGYWLIKLLKRDEAAKQAFVKVILLGSEKEAQEVRARLEAGEDFATLAKEFSQHDVSKEKGGDLDVTSPDMISSACSKFVFDPEVELETLSQPIRDEAVTTKGGYWLLKVVDIEDNRKISDEDKELLKNAALNKWIEATVNNPDNKVESYLDDEKKAWAVMQTIGR